ncbi:hypothetical protein [Bernardetia sp. MNP-M8]|uniref:hypothetical protein n=1 Tax=Bernardetia sp. MNP-M8 TaxID=3127470 RepID=UPI0030D42572
MLIPTNTVSFFKWVKKRSEHYWSKEYQDSIASKDEIYKCEKWIIGAKWVGLTESQIEEVEKKYQVTFTDKHKAFLQILHSIDRKEVNEYLEEDPFFYNWIRDEEEIRYRLNWAFEQILFDILNPRCNFWLKSWGQKPKSEQEKEHIFKEQFAKSPQLLPIKSHRFIVNDHQNTILSIWGSDTIIYGQNFRHYLLNEISEHLNLSTEERKEVDALNAKEYKSIEYQKIPFWREIISSNS